MGGLRPRKRTNDYGMTIIFPWDRRQESTHRKRKRPQPPLIGSLEWNLYLSSRCWRCTMSPKGAHRWIVKNRTMTCRYCGETRRITTTAKLAGAKPPSKDPRRKAKRNPGL